MKMEVSTKAVNMLRKNGSDGAFVRITVTTGGCAGMTYDANIVQEKEDNDTVVYEDQGIVVITDQTSLPFLDGLNVDYSDDLISAGFRFNNSANESSCGCGSSFSVKDPTFSVSPLPQFNKGGGNCGS